LVELNDLELDYDEEEIPSYLTSSEVSPADLDLPSVPATAPKEAAKSGVQ